MRAEGRKLKNIRTRRSKLRKEHVYGSISSKMEAESAVRGVRNSKDAAESAFRDSKRCQRQYKVSESAKYRQVQVLGAIR